MEAGLLGYHSQVLPSSSLLQECSSPLSDSRISINAWLQNPASFSKQHKVTAHTLLKKVQSHPCLSSAAHDFFFFHRLMVLQALILESCYTGRFETYALAAQIPTATLQEGRPAAVTT